jgi:hypothetical protein
VARVAAIRRAVDLPVALLPRKKPRIPSVLQMVAMVLRTPPL